jgi:alpha 1,2-mannosyltransferase
MGQGDKETYLAAAMALNSSYYTVATNVATLGFRFNDQHEFKGCGTVQHNPLLDYSFRELHNASVTEASIKNAPSFIHAQTYKMDASKVADTFTAEINMRMWGAKEGIMEMFGRDVEKEVWSETLYTGCQLENSFKAWEGKTGVCKKIGRVYQFLFG